MNEEIAFFGLIDSNRPQSEWMVYDRCDFTRDVELNYVESLIDDPRLIRTLKGASDVRRIWPTVVEHLEANRFDRERLKQSIARNAPPVRRGVDLQVIPNHEEISVPELIDCLNLIRTLRNARATYAPPGKIRTPAIYFEAARTFIENEMDHWNRFFETPLLTRTVEGDHYSIFQQPEVVEFAKVFDRELPAAHRNASLDN